MTALLYKAGFSAPTIAGRFEMRGNTLYDWFDRLDAEPIDQAIHDDDPPGRPPELDGQQKHQLKDVLHESPREIGYDEPAWVPQLALRYINEEFGVEYSVCHVRDLMHEAGVACQTPRPLASADPEEREQFSEEFHAEWEELKEDD